MTHEELTSRDVRWRMLLSYYYFRKINLSEWLAANFSRPYPEIFLDSGAYSAMTQGASINLAEYASYIRAHQHVLSVYANLDVIKDAEATWRNQQRLEHDYGLSPLPVFHVSEPWQYLEKYIERYSYIALGVAGNRYTVYMPWLVKCFKLAHCRAVYHGFGITSWTPLTSFPWYSVDSSTWGAGFRFGEVPVFDRTSHKIVRIDLGSHQQSYRYASYLRSIGFDAASLSNRAVNTPRINCAIAAISYLEAEKWLTQRWRDVVIPERQAV